jgi:membrane dipeptidase
MRDDRGSVPTQSGKQGEKGCVDLLGFLGDVAPPMFDVRTTQNVLNSGVRLIHLTTSWPMQDWETTLGMHRDVVAQIQKHSEVYRIIRSREDLGELVEQGKIGVILGMQDPSCIGERLGRVEALFREGIRTIQLAYQSRNAFGSGFLAEKEDTGLSSLGRNFVAAVNDAGLIPDFSHLSMKTCLEALGVSRGPALISHTTARDVYDHPRGSKDSVFRALAEKNVALVGLLAMTFFLDPSDDSMAPMIRHIRHVAGIVGTGKVGVGSDGPVGGFSDVSTARALFLEKTRKLMDPDGRLQSRWPTHVPELGEHPKGMEVMKKALLQHFTTEEADRILGGNAWQFFEKCLP